jgi:hypothetical protein
MATDFLFNRLTKGEPQCSGTLAEPDGAPQPRFALQGTVNWMHALALVVEDEGIDWPKMRAFYPKVQRFNGLTDPAMNTVFEQLLMSLHYLSALSAMAAADSDRDLARVAVMAWYYGIYCAGSAMIAAQDGSQQQDHSGTANQWDRQIAQTGLAAAPFDYRLTTLIKNDAETEIAALRRGNTFTINASPTNPADARAACISYLSGCRGYYEWMICEDLKHRELRMAGLSDFRTKEGRKIRDDRLRGKSLSFMHQAFRYRGKANYRDALFLTYEAQVGTMLDGFIEDMKLCSRLFCVWLVHSALCVSERRNGKRSSMI